MNNTTNMISRKSIRLIGIAVLVTVLTVSGIMYAGICSSRSFVKPFSTETGWGYCVYYHNELLVRQTIVPAVPGAMAFPSRKTARQTGLLVLHRLRTGQDPTITEEDLLKLKVIRPS